ncbi:cell division protein CdvC [Sulfuracidifex tepidarius]|uniref:Cell division protein C n=1 Tax=Sulfuracidifex tepidarius TaxID=1294262 RepID=A0A510DUR7_9CREN|nr:cell division protein CdvC [Sulfuracidifex tepidarius]BBG23800.1 Cell division protein C [Sulfuracidifex tepidarius]BBG26555.1 Cell division protein C [Sulfuracidifex tepidarius]
MSTAQVMLEDKARTYAINAVNADRQGKTQDAIMYYKKAIEVLNQLINLYPDSVVRTAYEQMINEYKNRIAMLTNMVPTEEGPKQTSTSAEDLIVTEKPKVKFSDVIGLNDVKEALKEAVIYPSQRPDLFPLGWPRGILLYGPPGCGKTMIAAAIANEIDSTFMVMDAASIMSKWLGEAEKNVANVFKLAREKSKETGKPTIIFIDELDALLGIYSTEVGGEARVRNQFLKEMDGLLDKSDNFKVYVMGATNKPWRLDEPFLRRFQKRIYVKLPDLEQRKFLFKYYTSKIKMDSSASIDKLAEMSEGYTASDIRDLVQSAHIKVVKEMFKKGENEPRPITLEDFKEVINIRKPSVNQEMIKAYEAWTEKFKAL